MQMGDYRQLRSGAACADLDGLFNPRSIAVLGASSDPRKISGRPIQLLNNAKFAGAVYPINPRHSKIQGLRAYPDLASVPGAVDQALIGLPAAAVADAAEAAIAKGVRSIVVFSAGFAELDAAGAEAQSRLAARCAEAGVSLLGPNCLGAVSFASGAYSTFSHSLEFAPPEAGSTSMVSQSGAIGTYALVKGVARGVKFARFAATGNEADVDVAACIAWFARDPATKVILAYLESCKDGRRLIEALEQARLVGKPVIVLKGGSSTVGSHAAASHTGALAGSDAVYDAVFSAAGAARVRSFDEMLDIAYACAQPVLPAGRRLGVVTVSGGFGVMMADAAAGKAIDLPALPAPLQQKIRRTLAFAATANPVDVTPQLLNDFGLLPTVLAAMLEGDNFDTIAVFLGTMGLDPHLTDALVAAMLEARQRFPDKLFPICMMTTPETRKRLEAAGLMIFEDPDRVIAAISRLAGFHEAFRRPSARPIAAPRAATRLPAQLSESAAKALLGAAGVAFAPEIVARTAAEAVAAARDFGRLVALKIAADGIAHKSDIGGVLLNVSGDVAVAEGFAAVRSNVLKARPDARIEGVLIAPMIPDGVETVIGIHNDADFGPVAMFGLGGVYVEALKDVAFRLAPVSREDALDMIREVRGFPALASARGGRPVDLSAIADAIAALSRFASAHRDDVETIDVNPFLALPEGGVAVDALIVVRHRPASNKAASHE
jgi:acyl-CoA synthetase (NDP forming)